MKQLLEQFKAFWAGRQPRERTLLVSLAAFLIIALVAQLLWTSHQARVRLRKQVPMLIQQVGELQRKASDLQRLKTDPATPTPADGNALLATAIAAANTAGMPEAAPQLKLESARRLRLKGTLPFDRWVEWTAALQRDGQIRLITCRIDADVAPGAVTIDALLALPEPS